MKLRVKKVTIIYIVYLDFNRHKSFYLDKFGLQIIIIKKNMVTVLLAVKSPGALVKLHNSKVGGICVYLVFYSSIGYVTNGDGRPE